MTLAISSRRRSRGFDAKPPVIAASAISRQAPTYPRGCSLVMPTHSSTLKTLLKQLPTDFVGPKLSAITKWVKAVLCQMYGWHRPVIFARKFSLI